MTLALRGPGWRRHGSVSVRGRVFDRRTDRLLDSAAIAERLADAADHTACHADGAEDGPRDATLKSVADAAGGLDGFYAAVVELGGRGTPDGAILVADGARSVPLYYGVRDDPRHGSKPEPGVEPGEGDELVVSDRGRVVRDVLDAPLDPVTESEFLLTRYVTGAETVWRGVRSTEAGTVVAVSADGDHRTVTYRDHRPGIVEPVGGDEGEQKRSRSPRTTAEAKELLKGGLTVAFDRLERVAGDRRIVVPLSGGYDSRLIASELVARGRDPIAYTFGRSGHPDVELSREVAARLGIDWEFVAYDEGIWERWYAGPAGDAYERAAFGGDALPFLAEWPALRTLVAEGRVPTDALWCPGHTVSTPGERLPAFTNTGRAGAKQDPPSTVDDASPVGCGPATDAADDGEGDDRESIEPTVDALTSYILRTHYELWPWRDERFRQAAKRRIRRELLGDAESRIDGVEAAAAAYERWEWRGRMTTFTNGDLRAYEDAGVEAWLPLWDPAYVRAYASLPSRFRVGKRLHAAVAVERYREVTGIEGGEGTPSQDRATLTDRTLPPIDRHLSLIRHTPVRQFTERGGRWDPPFLAPRSAWGKPGSHPLAWNAIVESDVRERLPPYKNLYAIRTLATTGRIDLADPGEIEEALFVDDNDGWRLRLPTEEL